MVVRNFGMRSANYVNYMNSKALPKPSKGTDITQKPLNRGKGDASPYTSKVSDIRKKDDAESVDSPKFSVTYMSRGDTLSVRTQRKI